MILSCQIIAKKLRPTSIRAKFGTSTVKNAVHCTDLCLDAEMEVDYFFRILQMLWIETQLFFTGLN